MLSYELAHIFYRFPMNNNRIQWQGRRSKIQGLFIHDDPSGWVFFDNGRNIEKAILAFATKF